MAAADWLEEEEEDELTMYWDRFDAAKAASKTNVGEQAKDRAVQVSAGQSTPTSTKGGNDANLSTEELLERYHESRGINKEEERKYGAQIEEATRSASDESSYHLGRLLGGCGGGGCCCCAVAVGWGFFPAATAASS